MPDLLSKFTGCQALVVFPPYEVAERVEPTEAGPSPISLSWFGESGRYMPYGRDGPKVG